VAAVSVSLAQFSFLFPKSMGITLLKQKINIIFSVKLEKNATDIYIIVMEREQ
jgi:hypothetical protein